MHCLRQAEVEDFDSALACEEQVVGLEIAVRDVFRVGGSEPMRDLHRVINGLTLREWAARQHFAQAFPFEQLDDHVMLPFLLTDVVNGKDIGMAQRGDCPGFLLEASQALGVCRERGGQYLDGYIAAEPQIVCPVDLAHAARADQRYDFVGPEVRSGGKTHGMSAIIACDAERLNRFKICGGKRFAPLLEPA